MPRQPSPPTDTARCKAAAKAQGKAEGKKKREEMIQTVVSRILWFAGLLLLQALVFNHIHIYGYATPMPYIYFLLILPDSTPRWAYVALGFALGFSLDLFTTTPGVAAASMTLCGLVTPWALRLFAPSDDDENAFYPSRRTMKWGGFLRYAFTLCLLHCLCFLTLEAFSLHDPVALALSVAASTMLTLLVVAVLEYARTR